MDSLIIFLRGFNRVFDPNTNFSWLSSSMLVLFFFLIFLRAIFNFFAEMFQILTLYCCVQPPMCILANSVVLCQNWLQFLFLANIPYQYCCQSTIIIILRASDWSKCDSLGYCKGAKIAKLPAIGILCPLFWICIQIIIQNWSWSCMSHLLRVGLVWSGLSCDYSLTWPSHIEFPTLQTEQTYISLPQNDNVYIG